MASLLRGHIHPAQTHRKHSESSPAVRHAVPSQRTYSRTISSTGPPRACKEEPPRNAEHQSGGHSLRQIRLPLLQKPTELVPARASRTARFRGVAQRKLAARVRCRTGCPWWSGPSRALSNARRLSRKVQKDVSDGSRGTCVKTWFLKRWLCPHHWI